MCGVVSGVLLVLNYCDSAHRHMRIREVDVDVDAMYYYAIICGVVTGPKCDVMGKRGCCVRGVMYCTVLYIKRYVEYRVICGVYGVLRGFLEV